MKEFSNADSVNAVLELLAAAVSDAPRVEMDPFPMLFWKQVLGICTAQNIHTLVYDYLPSNIPSEIEVLWRTHADAVKSQNERIASVVEVQERAWRKLGLEYALLKGGSLSSMYAHPEHRGSGDVDWCFFDESSFDKAKAVAERNADEGIAFDSDGDLKYQFRGIVAEHHRDWTHLSSGRLRKAVGRPVITDGRLSPEDTLFMLEMHILHHLAYSGIGLKQFADLAVALRYYEGKYDREAFAERLERVSLAGWSAILHGFLVEYLSVPSEVCPIPPKVGNRDVDRLLAIVFQDGCVPQKRKLGWKNLFARSILFFRISKREWMARYSTLLRGRITRISK